MPGESSRPDAGRGGWVIMSRSGKRIHSRVRASGAGSSRGHPGRWLLVVLLVSLAVEIECPARAENTPRAEREATCRSYATLLAPVAADRERAGGTNVLAGGSVSR